MAAVVGFADKVNAPAYVGAPRLGEMAHTRQFTGIASIDRAANGRLWATWYAGLNSSEDITTYGVLATSMDDGYSWQEVFVVNPDTSANDTRRTFDPQVWVGPDNVLRWFWADGTGIGTSAATAGNNGTWMLALGDANTVPSTPGTPRCIAAGVMMGKPLVLNDGAWAFPVANWFQEGSSQLLVSTDGGATFTRRGGATIPFAQRTFDEHMFVPLSNDVIRCWARTGDGVRESISTDGGVTWPEMAPPANLRHTSSRLFVRRLSSGNVLLVKHGALMADEGRRNLTAYLSTDGGDTWQGGLLIDARDGAAYPDGVEGTDGVIRLVYDYDRTGRREILFATFTEADVLAKKNASGKVRLAQRVTEPVLMRNDLDQPSVGHALRGDGATVACIGSSVGIPSVQGGEFTLEAWVNPAAYSSENRVVGQYAPNAAGRMLVYIGNNTGSGANDKVGVFVGNGNGYPSFRAISKASVPLNAWTHIAVVVGAYDVRFYINGAFDSATRHTGVCQLPLVSLTVGGIEGTFPIFNGRLAEVRAWRRARSGFAIARDYRHRLMDSETDLVARWPLDEADAAAEGVRDAVSKVTSFVATGHFSSVEENALALHPASLHPVGKDLARFLSKSGQGVTTDVMFGANESFTLEAWVRPRAYQDELRIMGLYTGGVDGRQIFELNKGKVGHYANGANGNIYPTAGSDIPLWGWTHVAMSRTMETIRLYVNGRLVGTQNCPFRANIQTAPLFLGGAPGNASFNGDLREFRAWRGVRSDAAIASNAWHHLTGREEGLAGYWPFTDRATAASNWVTGVTGAFGQPNWVTDTLVPRLMDEPRAVGPEPNRWAPLFTGGDGQSSARTAVRLTQDFTLEAWVNPSARPNRSYIFTQFSPTGYGRLLFSLNDGKLGVGMWDESLTGYQGGWVTSPNLLPLDTWSHVAFTRRGSVVTLYENGKAVATKADFITTPVENQPLCLAYRSDGPVGFFGMLAEARAWGKARTQEEIAQTMGRRLRGTEAGLLGSWPLEEGANGVMTDASKNAAHGTITALWHRTFLELAEPLPPGGTLFLVR